MQRSQQIKVYWWLAVEAEMSQQQLLNTEMEAGVTSVICSENADIIVQSSQDLTSWSSVEWNKVQQSKRIFKPFKN